MRGQNGQLTSYLVESARHVAHLDNLFCGQIMQHMCQYAVGEMSEPLEKLVGQLALQATGYDKSHQVTNVIERALYSMIFHLKFRNFSFQCRYRLK